MFLTSSLIFNGFINKVYYKKCMEKTAFIQFFGDSPFYRVLDFFIDNFGLDFSKSEVARATKVSRMTLNLFWDSLLVKKGIVIKTKKIGKMILYRLNTNSEIVKKFREMDFILSKALYEKPKQVLVPA